MDILDGLCYAKIFSKMPPLKAMTGRDPDFVRTGLIETDREIRSVFFLRFCFSKSETITRPRLALSASLRTQNAL
jgi:hypothetical protein